MLLVLIWSCYKKKKELLQAHADIVVPDQHEQSRSKIRNYNEPAYYVYQFSVHLLMDSIAEDQLLRAVWSRVF